MKYSLAIFDLDGTILNTLEDLKRSLNFALRSCRLPPRSLNEVRRFVGNGIGRLIERGLPIGTPADQMQEVLTVFHAHYEVHCADHTQPYTGIPELLCALRAGGVQTAVVSNKADYAVQTLCRQYFDGLFDRCAGVREGQRHKPFPDTVEQVLTSLQVPKKNAVLIGDSDVDVQTAQNAGLDFIGVSWGFRDRTVLAKAGAKRIVDSPADLKNLLL